MPRRPIGAEAMSPAQRQAKRRALFDDMRSALQAVCAARTVEEARALASVVLARQYRAHPDKLGLEPRQAQGE